MRTLLVPGDRQLILERLSSLKPGSPRQWGMMSAHQMICHLNDSFLAVLGERPASSATGFFQRTVVKWVALNVPMQWPRSVPTRPEIDQTEGGTPPADFELDRQQLVALTARFVETTQWSPHPIFGDMSQKEWMRWAYLHMDHHLRQFGC